MQTIKQMREFAANNKINLHGARAKAQITNIISEWRTPEFRLKHT